MSYFSVDRFASLQRLSLSNASSLFISNWSGDAHPAKLFEGVNKRLQIVLARREGEKSNAKLLSSRYLKWYSEERPHLFRQHPIYQQINPLPKVAFFESAAPKLSSGLELAIIDKLKNCGRNIASLISPRGDHHLYYTRKVSFFLQFLNFVPEIRDGSGKQRTPSELKTLNFVDQSSRDISLACLSTSLFYWYYVINSDCRNLNRREIVSFPVPSVVPSANLRSLERLLEGLMQSYRDNSTLKTVTYKGTGDVTVQYFNFRPSKTHHGRNRPRSRRPLRVHR